MSHADDLIYEWDPVFGPVWDTAAHQLSGEVEEDQDNELTMLMTTIMIFFNCCRMFLSGNF